MEINKLIKKYQDKLINITEARASDNKAGDHTFNMEYDEGEKNINEFIVDLKELEAINYTHCSLQLKGDKYTKHFLDYVEKFFKYRPNTYEYVSKDGKREYNIKALFKYYERAMNESPFIV